MARNPKQDANLKPYKKGELTSEEAKKRGSSGGKKSGEVRRQKRDLRQAMRYILERPANEEYIEQLRRFNLNPEDGMTNMEVMLARLWTMASSGNIDALNLVTQYAGYNTEENRKERESINADRRRDAEVQFKMDAMASRNLDAANLTVNLGNEDGGTDVMIYLPQITPEEELELPEEDEEVEFPEDDGKGE